MRRFDRIFSIRDHGIVSCIGLVLFVVLSVAGCGSGSGSNGGTSYSFKDPSGQPVKAVLKTTVPLAYAASVAMAAVTGTVPSNASTTGTCSSYPCSARVTITDNDSSMPLRLGDFGTITVYGYWTSPNDAILTVAFGNDAGSSPFPVHDIAVFPVSKSANKLTIVYASIDINATVQDPGTLPKTEIDLAFLKLNITPSTDAHQNVNLDAWVVQTDDKNTTDVADDTYSISGGGEYIETSAGSASVLQLGMATVVMGPGCDLNPGSGFAVQNELASASSDLVLATAVLSFHSSCNGRASVDVGIGNYFPSTGTTIPLNLNTL